MADGELPKRAEAGVVIGGYELVRRIGRGGMAEVWGARKALGTKGSKFVAIKLIADHYVGDDRYVRMFRVEAELAAVLSHANIVQVFDEGEEDGRSFLVMEWVDGLNLAKLGGVLSRLDEDLRRFRVTAYIIGQLLHALHYAHSITSPDGSPLGVVHRDVSPQNVLVSNHGDVKLTDFGVAFHNFEESSGLHVKGKVRYMPPEQLRGVSRSATVDLYAVGALLHELLDGKKFRGELEDGQTLFMGVLAGQVSALSRPAPPPLEYLRLALLQPDPARRVQTAEDALALLKRYPDYGDARDELSRLCGGMTGVVKPRTGPGQSARVAAAARCTIPPSRTPLAKPRVDPLWPALPPLPPPGVRTGSTTAVKAGTAGQQPGPGAMITGDTEIVWSPPLPAFAVSGGTEIASASATEHEIAVAMLAGDGTDTAHDPRAGWPPQNPSSRVVPLRGMTVAAIGLGSAMAAILSVSSLWLVLSQGQSTKDAVGGAVPWFGFEPRAVGKGVEPEGDERSIAAGGDAASVGEGTDASGGTGIPEEGRPASGGMVATMDALATQEDAVPRTTASSKPRRAATKKNTCHADAADQAFVKVTSSSGFKEARVEVGSQSFAVDARRYSIDAGRKRIKWRESEGAPWRSVGWRCFRPGRTIKIHINNKGELMIARAK